MLTLCNFIKIIGKFLIASTHRKYLLKKQIQRSRRHLSLQGQRVTCYIRKTLIEVVHRSPSGGWVWFCCNVGPVSIFGYKALFAVLVVQWIWRFGKYLPLLLEAIFITTLKIFEYYCKLLEIVSWSVSWHDINFHFFSLLPFFTDLSAGLAEASHEGKYIYFLYNLLYMQVIILWLTSTFFSL